MAGNREKDWGKEKVFREGQAEQVLDTLFFDFIDLAKELQPKIVVAENVAGMMMGTAKEYVKKVYTEFQKAGYELKVEPYLLDSSNMGIPQRRKRVFFVALRKDLAVNFMESVDMFQVAPKLEFNFNEPQIKFGEIKETYSKRKPVSKSYLKHWIASNNLGRSQDTKNKNTFGFFYKAMNNLVCSTITSGGAYAIEDKPELLTDTEFCKVGSYPLDYEFQDNKPQYLIGMSVPPVMVAHIASNIYDQWLSKINNK